MRDTDIELLKFLGFKRKGDKYGYWFELRFKNHIFLTCDDDYCKLNKRNFIIGYQNSKHNDRETWFNNNVKNSETFMSAFKLMTGHIFCLNGRHKKITTKNK